MGISQSRMIDLIHDCGRAAQSLERLKSDLWQVFGLKLDEKTTVAMLESVLATHQRPLLEAFLVERAHFAKVERYNEKKRRYMAGKRRVEGKSERLQHAGLQSPEPYQFTRETPLSDDLSQAVPWEGEPAPPLLEGLRAKAWVEEKVRKWQDNTPQEELPQALRDHPVQPRAKPGNDVTPDLTDFDNTLPDMSKGVF